MCFTIEKKKKDFEDCLCQKPPSRDVRGWGTEGGLHRGFRQPSALPLEPGPLEHLRLHHEKTENSMISRAALGLPLSSSSPYLASPLSSLKSSPPKTFQPLPQRPLPRPQLDLGFSRDSLPHLESPLPASLSTAPVFPTSCLSTQSL